jgi:hypothetical protein
VKGVNGVQMQVHPKFLEMFKEIQDGRVRNGKDHNKELSHKRLSLTVFKLFQAKPDLVNLLLNAEIDKNEQ